MNKLIWKGIDSSTIKGLLICELPPITKPKMRVQETVIDGVDGSIIEELGYESYDKTIKIGLTYDFDVDAIIKYFSGEGEVVFSNEPDKYYKAKIINRVDYERLLRFREATVKFRVQPFKYQYNEEKMIAKTGRVEGTKIKINDVKATQLQVDGRSTQEIRSGINKFNASLIPTSTGIVVNEDGSKIIMPLATSSNGFADTHTKLSVLAPSLKVGDIVYLKFDTTSQHNNFIYIVTPQVVWYNGTSVTITQEMLNSKVGLYGNRFQNGETEQVTISNFRMVLGESDAEWEQYGATPSPDYPSEIKSVGTYNEGTDKYVIEVKTVGKNFLNVPSNYVLKGTQSFTLNLDIGNYIVNWENIVTNGEYLDMLLIFYYEDETTLIKYISPLYSSKMLSFSTAKPIKKLVIYSQNTYANSIDVTTTFTNLMISVDGGKYQPYYKPNTSVILLNQPLRSLPNGVKDIAYIKNNKLYVDRYVGSVVLNGDESIFTYEFNGMNGVQISNIFSENLVRASGVSNYSLQVGTYYSSNSIWCGVASKHIYWIGILDELGLSTADELKTWLSTNNTQVDYELATPVTEEYGDITILKLVDGENNISNSEDANMVFDYIEILNVNNLGNHTAKPIFEIEGVGKVDFMLNNSNVFSYSFDDDGKVVIDSEKEDAYLGLILKNRNMNGDFPIFNPGENKFTWDGLIKNISVSKKSRWL